jgi:dipeptidyl aminopeptidase/acylaminoacyl peptidase
MADRSGTARKTSRRFRPADLLRQVMIQDLAVAPDGSGVAYSRRTIEKGKYRRRLWRAGFERGAAEPLTAADASDGSPRFSPDGKNLLFLSDRSGRSQPWVMPLSGGEPRQLADLPGGNVGAADWSPDGRRVLLVGSSGVQRYVVGKPEDPVARRITDFTWRLDGAGYRDQYASAFVVPAAGGKPARLTEPSYEVIQAFWSPDGDRVGFVADLRPEAPLEELPQAWSLSAVPVARVRPKREARLDGEVMAGAWSPGGALAVLGIDRPSSPSSALVELFVVERGRRRQLGSELDRPLYTTTFGDLIDHEAAPAIAWLDDTALVALVSDAGATHPYRFDLDGHAEPLAGGDIVCTRVATGGGRVAVVATDRGRPGEVYGVEEGRLRPLTSNGSRWMAPYRKDPEGHRVRHPKGHDLDARVLRATGRRGPGPMVVDIHGGPHASHGPTPWLEMVALADAGFHVLFPNIRGSTSYGVAYTEALAEPWGEADSSDIMRLVEWAISEGIADPARVGLVGLSYGGYLVNELLGRFPGRFAAAVSENPVTDWLGMFAQSDIGTIPGARFGGLPPPWVGLDERLSHSPFTRIHRNEAPLLLLHCERDLRCPPGQSEMVFAILRSLGRTVELVRYPDESHYLMGMGRPDRRVDRIERIVGWFQRYLKPTPRTPRPSGP